MSNAIERLLAESEIRQLIARYSDAVFRLDAEAYRKCWAKDGAWHAFGHSIHGAGAITDFWETMMKTQIPMAWQVVNTLILEIDGSTARGLLRQRDPAIRRRQRPHRNGHLSRQIRRREWPLAFRFAAL